MASRNLLRGACVNVLYMRRIHSWAWLTEQVARTSEIWNTMPARIPDSGPVFTPAEQREREAAYDDALEATEREARKTVRSRSARLEAQKRIIASFARFAAIALGLEDAAIHLLTEGFLPIGTQFAQGARRFDPEISQPDIIQACRNAWTACGLQPLLGEPMAISPSIVGYSLLYPYSDNYLDSGEVSARDKLRFSARFRDRLNGDTLMSADKHEDAIWKLVALIEAQYPRAIFPQVYDCLIAIHRAQEESMAQLRGADACDDSRVLAISCAKGGSSVLADACLAHGWLNEDESEFAFEWGTLLQLGDDLQDVIDDVRRGSATLFSRTAAAGKPLDDLAARLLNMSERVSDHMDCIPHGEPMLKSLLRMSWRSLVVMSVANAQECFTSHFLANMERRSPFRFDFLRARKDRLEGSRGLYSRLFEAVLEPREDVLPATFSVALAAQGLS
jgi:hypothetical protein